VLKEGEHALALLNAVVRDEEAVVDVELQEHRPTVGVGAIKALLRRY